MIMDFLLIMIVIRLVQFHTVVSQVIARVLLRGCYDMPSGCWGVVNGLIFYYRMLLRSCDVVAMVFLVVARGLLCCLC